jgi:hypothetical protein
MNLAQLANVESSVTEKKVDSRFLIFWISCLEGIAVPL